ncbi:MAG: PmbA/TldA family metallopeptidase, partial [Candidatus Heimdallarchaeota archaeon]
MTLSSSASDAIDFALKTDADYVDVRVENVFANFIGLRNNAICGVNTNLEKAIGVRVLYKNCWGFASASSLDNSSIKRIVESALKTAKKTAERNSRPAINLAKVSTRKTSVSDTCKNNPQFIEQKDRLELLNRINDKTTSLVKEINVLDLKLLENHTQKLFLNSEGSEIEQVLIRASLFMGSSVSGSSNFQKVRSVGYGGVGGIEQFDQYDFEHFHNRFINTLPEIAQAKLVKPKEQPVILNEEIGWNLCH